MEGIGEELIMADLVGLPLNSLVFVVISSLEVIEESTLKSVQSRTQRVTQKNAIMEKSVEKKQMWPTHLILFQLCLDQYLRPFLLGHHSRGTSLESTYCKAFTVK